jgi:hypothetical protein
MAKPKMSFYDVKSKKKFDSENYSVKEKSGRFFAVSPVPGAQHEAWRVLSAEQAKKLK